MATKQAEVEAGLEKEASPGISTIAPRGSPLTSAHREALLWLAETGLVTELDLPGLGRVVLRASAAKQQVERINLADILNPKSTKPLVVGGYDPEILFAAVDSPIPDLPNEPAPGLEDEET